MELRLLGAIAVLVDGRALDLGDRHSSGACRRWTRATSPADNAGSR